MQLVAIIDYGSGNLHSAAKAFERAARPERVSAGIVLTFLVLLNPGDEILLPDPGFVMYRQLANLCGATVRYYNLYPKQPGGRFALDVGEIERLCTSRTKIVFLNSPSNPTGAMLFLQFLAGT